MKLVSNYIFWQYKSVHSFETFNKFSRCVYFNISIDAALQRFSTQYLVTEDAAIEKYQFDESKGI